MMIGEDDVTTNGDGCYSCCENYGGGDYSLSLWAADCIGGSCFSSTMLLLLPMTNAAADVRYW